MLIKYLPEQVSDNWNILAPYIASSLPPITSRSLDGMSNVLRSILFGDLTLWIYFDGKNEDAKAIYVVTTIPIVERVTLERSLLIYSFTGVRDVQPEHWAEGLKTLRKEAKGKDCNSIIAYTADERIANFLNENHNASINQRLVQMEV